MSDSRGIPTEREFRGIPLDSMPHGALSGIPQPRLWSGYAVRIARVRINDGVDHLPPKRPFWRLRTFSLVGVLPEHVFGFWP